MQNRKTRSCSRSQVLLLFSKVTPCTFDTPFRLSASWRIKGAGGLPTAFVPTAHKNHKTIAHTFPMLFWKCGLACAVCKFPYLQLSAQAEKPKSQNLEIAKI
jgi:hypothetical protein